MPPILQIALRAWAGESIALSLENVLVLFSPSPDISYAIQNSALLRPYLRGVLAPGYFLVRRDQLDELQAQLQCIFGMDVELAELSQKRFASRPKATIISQNPAVSKGNVMATELI
jgi:hypothetical protein